MEQNLERADAGFEAGKEAKAFTGEEGIAQLQNKTTEDREKVLQMDMDFVNVKDAFKHHTSDNELFFSEYP